MPDEAFEAQAGGQLWDYIPREQLTQPIDSRC